MKESIGTLWVNPTRQSLANGRKRVLRLDMATYGAKRKQRGKVHFVGRISDSVMRRMIEPPIRRNTATAYCALRGLLRTIP